MKSETIKFDEAIIVQSQWEKGNGHLDFKILAKWLYMCTHKTLNRIVCQEYTCVIFWKTVTDECRPQS